MDGVQQDPPQQTATFQPEKFRPVYEAQSQIEWQPGNRVSITASGGSLVERIPPIIMTGIASGVIAFFVAKWLNFGVWKVPLAMIACAAGIMIRTRIHCAFILLMLICFANPAHSTEPAAPSASEVVAKWKNAVHAKESAAQGVAEIEYTSNEDGIAGNIQEWVSIGSDYHRIVNRKFDRAELLLTADHAERLDWNAFLRKLDGQELRRWRTAAYETRVIAFGPTTEMEHSEIQRSSDGKSYELRFTPPDAEPITFFIAAETWLPSKSIRPGNDSEITRSYEDWRDAGGILVPYRSHVSETEKPDFDLQLTSLKIQSGKSADQFAVLHAGPSDVHWTSSSCQVPFNFESAHILFQVKVNGRDPLWFILDTGADQEVINEPRMPYYGLKTYAESTSTGGGNSAKYSYAEGATFSLPGVEIRNQHVAVIDETGLEAAIGLPIGGIVGYDFISRFVVGIDYENKLITLHKPETWNYSAKGIVVPIVFDEGIPFTNGSITVRGKDIPGYFVLDSGAAETMTLTSPFVEKHDLLNLAMTNATVNKPSGLEKQFFAQTNVRGRIDKLTLGTLTAESIPMNLSRNTSGAYASKNFSGTIGEGIYHRYHVFLDYFRNRVILEPTAEAAKPFPGRQTYGISLLASGSDLHTFTVVAVRPGSPAEKDGLQKGDMINGMDHEPASRLTLGQLREKLLQEGQQHVLEITRGNQKLALPITVRLISLDAT